MKSPCLLIEAEAVEQRKRSSWATACIAREQQLV